MALDKITNKPFLARGGQIFYCNLAVPQPYPFISIPLSPNIAITSIYGLAVDGKNKKVYYLTDYAGNNHIMTCNTDGSDNTPGFMALGCCNQKLKLCYLLLPYKPVHG